MTYMSFTLLGFAGNPSEAELEAANPKARVLSRIDRGDRFTPYELVDWAKKRRLPVTYVDGAWVRVPADRETICAFLADRMSLEELAQIRRESETRGENWVLEAEEF